MGAPPVYVRVRLAPQANSITAPVFRVRVRDSNWTNTTIVIFAREPRFRVAALIRERHFVGWP